MSESLLSDPVEAPAEGEEAPAGAPAAAAGKAAESPPAVPAADAEADKAQKGDPPEDRKADGDEGPPEAYADFTMPDGVEIDPAAAEELKTFAKEQGWSQATAQAVADIGAGMMQKWVAGLESARDAQSAAWATEVKADKDIGGDALAANLATAQKALDAFGGAPLKDVLNSYGLGNHPVLVKAFVQIGKAISEDNLVPSGRAARGSDPESRAASLYPSMRKD